MRVEEDFVSKMNLLSHYPVVGIGVGALRTGYGVIKTAVSIIQSLGRVFQGKRKDLKGSNIAAGLAQIGRGILEMIPLIGRSAAILFDQNTISKKAKQLALNGDIDAAIQAVKTMPYNYTSMDDVAKDMTIRRIAEAFIQADRIDEAKSLYEKWDRYSYQGWCLLDLVKRYTDKADDQSIAIANELEGKIQTCDAKKQAREYIDSHINFANRRLSTG